MDIDVLCDVLNRMNRDAREAWAVNRKPFPKVYIDSCNGDVLLVLGVEYDPRTNRIVVK